MSENENEKIDIIPDITWRPSSNPRCFFCSDQDFLASNYISKEAKGLYDKYCKETDTTKLERNAKGYYKTKWKFDDSDLKFTFTATYDDNYGWGIMRVPLRESTAEQKARLERIESKIDEILNILKGRSAS